MHSKFSVDIDYHRSCAVSKISCQSIASLGRCTNTINTFSTRAQPSTKSRLGIAWKITMSSLTFMVSQLSSLTFAFTHWPNQNVRQAPIADSTDSKRPTVSTAEMGAPLERVAKSAPGSYTAFGLKQQRVITTLITAAGFLGPLAAGVYLPVLAELEEAFHLSGAVINVSISVFMCILAFAVSRIL